MFNVCGTFPQDLANVIKNFQKTVHIFFRLQNYCSFVPKYGANKKKCSAVFKNIMQRKERYKNMNDNNEIKTVTFSRDHENKCFIIPEDFDMYKH